MKALFISNDPNLFDPNSTVRARMRLYADKLGELHIISTAPITTKIVTEGSLHLYPIHTTKIFRIRALSERAHALIEEQGIEVVSAQDPFEHGLAALRAVRGTSARLHIQVHTDFLSPWFLKTSDWRLRSIRLSVLNRWRCYVANRVLPRAKGIRVVSERIKISLVKRHGSLIVEPTVLPIPLPNYIPPSVLLPTRPFTYTLIAVGRIEPEKRIDDLLKALKLSVRNHLKVGLCIVGEGSERPRLERMVHTLGLGAHVVFLGSRPDAWGLMQDAQAFIQASAYEGYGRTLMEAALVKIPIITTDVGVVGEVFQKNKDVLSVPVADPAALSLAVDRLIENDQLSADFSRHAEESAHKHLTAENELIVRIVNDLLHTATQT